MKHTVSVMLGINGEADSDRSMVTEFCGDVVNAARSRLDRIKSIADLKSILDSAQLVTISDARGGIRHLHAALHQVFEHHHGGPYQEQFDRSIAEIVKIQEEAEGLHQWFNVLYSGEPGASAVQVPTYPDKTL